MNQEKYLLALRSLLTLTGEPAKKGESVENLEKLLICRAAENPVNLAAWIDVYFERSRNFWIKANNEGPNTYSESLDVSELNQVLGEKIMKVLGFRTIFPGLYPLFQKDGRDFNSTAEALIYLQQNNK